MTNNNSITANNVTTYLGLDFVTACGMTEIVNRDLITTSDFDTIFELTKKFSIKYRNEFHLQTIFDNVNHSQGLVL